MSIQLIKKKLKKIPILFILIKKIKSFTYDTYLIKKKNNLFLKNGKKVLFDFDNAFTEAGIKYWLAFGTLLGAVRERGFIGHDFDIDVGVFKNDYSPELEKTLIKHGFKKAREFLIDGGEYGIEQTYTKNGVSIDIFFFIRGHNKIYCHVFDNIKEDGTGIDISKNEGFAVRELTYDFTGFSKVNLFAHEFMVPNNFKEVLISDYGYSYMTPDPNYISGKRDNVRYLSDKKGYLTVF